MIFADISEPSLECCRRTVEARGLLDRAEFVVADAEDLAGVGDQRVDVVTTRSVLIYVVDKAKAFRAFHRVLREGGRISLYEPINRLMYPEPAGRFYCYDLSVVSELVEKVDAALADQDPRLVEAMMGFDDRDLVRLAEEAGLRACTSNVT